jgi:hypothetical protein
MLAHTELTPTHSHPHPLTHLLQNIATADAGEVDDNAQKDPESSGEDDSEDDSEEDEGEVTTAK